MNRIYQGRVVKVALEQDNLPLSNGGNLLWQNHELFQDAVNYYTLGLAAMAAGLEPHSPQSKAALAWRQQVRDSWITARRRATRFAGPYARLAGWLGVDRDATDPMAAFEACAAALLKNTPASPLLRAEALVQMLEEVDDSDLNQFCVGRLPWLCSPHGKLNATPRNLMQQQERLMLATVRSVHESPADGLEQTAAKLDLGCFVSQAPKETMSGTEARAEAVRLFQSALRKAKSLSAVSDGFNARLAQLDDALRLPRLGRKPKGAYPLAVVFKLFPTVPTWEAFKAATASLRKRADKPPAGASEIARDCIAELRTEADQPVFEYFTNRALFREPDNEDRAVWFEFDLAAFIEAIKAPHRYFQDSLAREKEAQALRQRKLAMEGRGTAPGVENEDDEDDQSETGFGFEDDERITLLRELVTTELAHLAETEHPEDNEHRIEYTIQERTLRGFAEVKEQWRRLEAQGQATKKNLLQALALQQARHRDDFGSAELYRSLAQERFQPIWQRGGTEPWHAADPLQAWCTYKALCAELEEKERPIRFTPAHAEHSPRYFIIPKQGRLGSKHQPGTLAFTCGLVLQTQRGREPVPVRITYSAPRLLRDQLRRLGDEELEAVPWLQPMMQALGLPDPDTQDFANCRITLQPCSPDNIQLTFPVEVNPEKLAAHLGKARLWERQFNLHPEGDQFLSASLRWPHEEQPAKPPVPWHQAVDRFAVLATDLGQSDAGAYALLDVSAKPTPGNRPARLVGETPGKRWRATLTAAGMLRLPGEDRMEWRAPSAPERAIGQAGFAWREELYGERGRLPTADETKACAELVTRFGCTEEELLPPNWGWQLSFPEQNDKLLVAARRAQSRVARLHRWCWFLTEPKSDQQPDAVCKEIAQLDDERFVPEAIKELARKNQRVLLVEALKTELQQRLADLPGLLEKLADRCLPLRGRRWKWGPHPQKPDCGLLQQIQRNGPGDESVLIRGQRGLSFERIEQIEELRRRFQSLNQMLRRQPGGPPPKRRDDAIPDPCPALLEKLDRIKQQRVYQTAHLILAQALGVRLAAPPQDKAQLRQARDVHGAYERVRDPVDFVVIEDLSRYRASQGRSPRENSRLMKWCHRSVRDKLRQLCKPFGIPVLETPAAWSSRFCSRSGVAGFRAEEVAPGFQFESRWAWLARAQDAPSEEARCVQELIQQLEAANRGRDGRQKKYLTLLAPRAGGPIFVPFTDSAVGAELQPALAQADINAAINLALRAVADPRLWSIHPRLRTRRRPQDGALVAWEKRKFGLQHPPELVLTRPDKLGGDASRLPNFFADPGGCVDRAAWGEAILPDQTHLISGKALWTTVKQGQWERIRQLNQQRLARWKAKNDELPM